MKFLRRRIISTYAIVVAGASNLHLAHSQVEPLCESFYPYSYDSGETSTTATTIVSYPRAPWIQLDLSGTVLSPNAKLVLYGEKGVQELDAAALASNSYSAVFDGDKVELELVSDDNVIRGSTSTSRIIVPYIKVGICDDDGTEPSICGDVDDRIPSTDERAGRIGGCTGWLIDTDVFVQAGHCGTPSASTRIHFTYGTGNAPVEDQYAVDVSTYRFLNGGVGSDWGAARLLPNSSTNKLPGVAQLEKCLAAEKGDGCGWYILGSVPSTDNNIRITGYGTATVDSRSQKTHVGALTTIASTYLRYVPDTTGGNSGSPVIHEETGHAVGIHTHGGCSATGGSNLGTRADRSDFMAHVEFLMMDCTADSQCDDGIWCNGDETCDANGRCQFGTPRTCSDGLACTDDICNESLDRCENPVTNCLASSDPCATDVCIESQGGCQFTCGARLDTWLGISGTSIANLMSGTNNLQNAPSKTVRLGSLLEGPTNVADNYGSRVTGWLVPPVSGEYEFWIATDDNGELYLSADDEPANKSRIAHVPVWAGSRDWVKYVEQHSSPISLEAGQAYYMEVLMKEGSGGDNLAVAWQYPGQAQEVIPASFMRMTRPAPQTSSPTDPPTSPPTNAPTKSPTTNAPTGACNLAKVDQPCVDSVDCCSGLCSGGKPSTRVCLTNGGSPPTPTPPPPSPPTGGCDGAGVVCSGNNCCNGCQGGNGPSAGYCKA